MVLVRCLNIVARALPEAPEKVIPIGGSECTIAALEKKTGTLGPFFSNRVAEIRERLVELKEVVENVEPFWHVASELNPADLGTRGHARLPDLEPGTVWQEGPDFLKKDREVWPLSRDFRRESIPSSELRDKHEVFGMEHTAVMRGRQGFRDTIGLTTALAIHCMARTEDWQASVKLLARGLRSLLGSTSDPATRARFLTIQPSASDLEAARNLQYLASMGPTWLAIDERKLRADQVTADAGIVYLSGRLSQGDLSRVLGKSKLPVLMPSTRMARLIMVFCHEEDHRRTPKDALARSRNYAWIPRGRKLAETVTRSCIPCREWGAKTASQVMADLPEDMLQLSPPFTGTALDMFGPYSTRGMGANHRRSTKTWGLLMTCIRTKAVAVLACEDYTTRAFLTAFSKFTDIYGCPALVISDHGPQMVSAVKILAGNQEIDWERVTEVTAPRGTRWKFTEKACSWRNGLAERAVRLIKDTLQHQLDGNRALNFAEVDAVFTRCARIVNSRPIGVRNLSEDDFHAITPGDFLLGRAAGPRTEQEAERALDTHLDPEDFLSAQSDLTERWWQEWQNVAFPLLTPRRKWTVQHRNMQEGDVVLLKYDKKFSKAKYRLARVSSVFPDDKGTVRTVAVRFRPRDVREDTLPYVAKTPTEMRVGVQRLVVIQPVEEQRTTATKTQGDTLRPAVVGGPDMDSPESGPGEDAGGEMQQEDEGLRDVRLEPEGETLGAEGGQKVWEHTLSKPKDLRPQGGAPDNPPSATPDFRPDLATASRQAETPSPAKAGEGSTWSRAAGRQGPQGRRSRRQRGLDPEHQVFLADMERGRVPRPWHLPQGGCRVATYTLHHGAAPLLVPDWVPEVLNERVRGEEGEESELSGED